MVDDEDSARQLLRAVLEDAGAHVTLCRTTSDALEVLARDPFDVFSAIC